MDISPNGDILKEGDIVDKLAPKQRISASKSILARF
jgi:hypothetical protein